MIGNMVSIATDISSGWCSHTLGALPPELYEAAQPMDWLPGGALGRHSLARTVKHKSQGLVLDGHDLGPLLMHCPMNYPIVTIKSSRKTIYTASTVVTEGKAVACIDQSKGTTMMLCGDPISQATGVNDTNPVHSVSVGMSELDYFKGRVSIAVSMATDVVNSAIGLFAPSAVSGLGDLVLDAAGIDFKKAELAMLAGLIGSVAVSYKSGWKEPIVFKYEVGGAYIGGSADHQWIPSSGTVTSKQSVNVVGLKGEASTDYSKLKAEGTAWGGEPVQETWGDSL